MGNLADHNATSVAEKKFWQVFSAKNIIKWYEYRMADSENADEAGDEPEELADKVSKIMDAFNNAKQDSVDSLLKELHATSQEDDGSEIDADMEDEVARIMAQFADAKQNSVDSLFAVANAATETENAATEDTASSQSEDTGKIVVERPEHPSTFDPDFGKLNADIDMNMISGIVNAQQNDIAALFAAQEAATAETATPEPITEPENAEPAEASSPEPNSGPAGPLPEDMDPAMAAEVARIMAMFADAKQDSIDTLFRNQ